MIKFADEKNFIMMINLACEIVHENSVNQGFWPFIHDDVDIPKVNYAARNKAEMIALMHSELSECLEAIRSKDIIMDQHCPEFTSEEIEMADTCIRVFDYAKAFNLRLGEAVLAKHKFNESRPYKHGKTF